MFSNPASRQFSASQSVALAVHSCMLCKSSGHMVLKFHDSRIDRTYEISLPVRQLFRQLDCRLPEENGDPIPDSTLKIAQDRQRQDDEINQSLQRAMRAFAAPWLTSTSQHTFPGSNVQDFIRDSWRAARKDMLRVIHRTAYRSILAMYLFAQTPIPMGIPDDEELDGISGQVCMQTAFFQLQRLRAQQAIISPDSTAAESPLDSAALTPQHVGFESRAYWAAMMWDTSNSLILGARTSLSSGLKGACSEPTWRLVKAYLIGSFKARSETWHDESFGMTEADAYDVLSAGSICNTYIWENIASLKEGLREGVNDDCVLFAWKALLDAINIYNTLILPLLHICKEGISTLLQRVRLNWYNINIQHYLGLLLLENALYTAARSDLLHQIDATLQAAETNISELLQFGLESTYTIHRSDGGCASTNDSSEDNGSSQVSSKVTLVAIYPYPQYMVAMVLFTSRRSQSMFLRSNTDRGVNLQTHSTLLEVLQQLPQSSKSVQDAIKSLTSDIGDEISHYTFK